MTRQKSIDMKFANKPALSIVIAAAAGAAIWNLRSADSDSPPTVMEKEADNAAVVGEAGGAGTELPVLASGDPATPPTARAPAKAAAMAGHPALGRPLLLTRRIGQRREYREAARVPPDAGGNAAQGQSAAASLVAADRLAADGSQPAESQQGKQAEEQRWWATLNFGFGAGVDRFPRWLGAGQAKSVTIPYINVNWQDHIQFSTVDGLIIDAIHGERWHGGLVGTMLWGRSRSDLGYLADRVPTRSNTLQAGAYIEYAATKELSVGMRVRHDIQPTGAAYGDVYLDMDLPAPGPVDHSIRIAAEAMNQGAMRRFFGVSQEIAGRLGVPAYRPGSGMSQYSATYQAFVPTSEHTGFALAASLGKLANAAADSPLVRSFGSPYQRNFMAAFVVHY